MVHLTWGKSHGMDSERQLCLKADVGLLVRSRDWENT